MTRPRLIRAVALAAGLLAATLAGAAPAKAAPQTIQVHPGPHAIQDALTQAHAGDTLNLHAGRYRVPNGLVVGKSVVISSAGDGVVTIDGRCQVGATLTAAANNVRLRGLRVVGAAAGLGALPREIDFNGVPFGEVSNGMMVETCGASGHRAEYGVNVFNSGAIRIVGNETYGFEDAGIYIGGINDTGDGTLMVRGNDTHNNVRGIIVEDSAGGSVAVVGNSVHGNRRQDGGFTNAGIFLHSSDGVRIRDNTVMNNGPDGIVLDGNSDHNRVIGNDVHGHTTDIRNDGAENCFSDNDYGTASGDVGDECS